MSDTFEPFLADRLKALLQAATSAGDLEPSAMSLATGDAEGRISVRIVLLKGIDQRGLSFFTNYRSRKAGQLADRPEAALCLHWKLLEDGVQVRVEGPVERLPETESDAYFASRARLSQIGAWASLQSQELPDRATFDQRIARYQQQFSGKDVPRPPHWGGFLLRPRMIEFWHARRNRLHERTRWTRDGTGTWSSCLLYP